MAIHLYKGVSYYVILTSTGYRWSVPQFGGERAGYELRISAVSDAKDFIDRKLEV